MGEITKNKEELRVTTVDSESIYKGRILDLYRDRVRLPNGRETKWEFLRHNGAVGVLPLTDKDEVVMVSQFRYPIGDILLEIPAGKLDTPDEDRLSAAKRELKEETGYTAENMIFLGDMLPAAAYTSEKVSIYLATGLTAGETDLDDGEFLYIERIPLKEAHRMAMSGEITDSKTVIAILKAYELKSSGKI